uniref:Putative fucosyl transferase n=1 Tax=Moumouvirus sp. 'Monve' TaxID=1128131 RepID=H2EDG6_9VIRU|nr:putative fucosyl transferase [Moumouvirus Monve]
MDKFKIVCINLERRKDRKDLITNKLINQNINNFEFFEAIDGSKIDPDDERLNLFKHSVSGLLRRGVTGCALSHYTIWKKLINDPDYNTYLVIEDDINFGNDFKSALEKILDKSPGHGIVLLGMTLELEKRAGTKHLYQYDTSYSVHNLNRNLYCGGAFGYIITKSAAEYLVGYISCNGIRIVIDYLMFRSGVPMYESHPHLVFTDAVQHSIHYVDSDIQHDYERIKYNKLLNNYQYDDYVFLSNRDSVYGDIREVCADIPTLKRAADMTPECVAFNTYGWLKNTLTDFDKFIVLHDKYYTHDGIYIKKSYFSLENKLKNLRLFERPIRIFLNNNTINYSEHLVNIILKNIPNYDIVKDNNDADIIIDNINDGKLFYDITKLNIIISGEPFNRKQKYDIAIDTKKNSNAEYTIYHPFLFSSLHEHKKSINYLDYVKPKTKFCAYMYHMSYPHRINYFNTISSYKHVDALGKCCNNVEIKNTRYVLNNKETYNDIAVEYFTQYKFVLAIENNMIPGYNTEKLINPMIANSIPIYWGDSEIFKYINKRRLVYIPDFATNEDLINHIKYIDEHDDVYENIIKESIFTDPNFTLDVIEQHLSKEIDNLFGLKN